MAEIKTKNGSKIFIDKRVQRIEVSGCKTVEVMTGFDCNGDTMIRVSAEDNDGVIMHVGLPKEQPIKNE